MSWRELAWSGMMRRKQPEDESTGVVTSVDLQTGPPVAAGPNRSAATTGRLAIAGPSVHEGLQVTVDAMRPIDDGRVTRVGRMRLGG